MALTSAQKVTVAEITYETPSKVNEITVALDPDIEDAIIADIAIWNANKNDVDVRLEGGRDGTNLVVDRLLEAVTIRVRNALGLSPLPSRLYPLGGVYAGGISQSDIDTRNADSDRPVSTFTSGLHSWGS